MLFLTFIMLSHCAILYPGIISLKEETGGAVAIIRSSGPFLMHDCIFYGNRPLKDLM